MVCQGGDGGGGKEDFELRGGKSASSSSSMATLHFHHSGVSSLELPHNFRGYLGSTPSCNWSAHLQHSSWEAFLICPPFLTVFLPLPPSEYAQQKDSLIALFNLIKFA